jgi:hypothetical protein
MTSGKNINVLISIQTSEDKVIDLSALMVHSLRY